MILRDSSAARGSRGKVSSACTAGRATSDSTVCSEIASSRRCLRLTRFVLALLCATGLVGCASIFYSKTAPGKFSGRLFVEWIAPNEFIYRPDKDEPLTFTTADGRIIRPKLMYTDGGSIPRLFWSAPDLGPWDFAPAYIIHDWLFEQQHCKSGDWADYSFEKSAQVLAQAMKAQMESASQPEPVIVYAVYQAVSSPIAERLWSSGVCKPPPSSPAPPPPGVPLVPAPAPVRLLTIDFR